MFSAVSILVVACAVSINAQIPQCGEAQFGALPTAHPVKLPPVTLDPYVQDWRITIPPVPECVLGVSGVHAYMCDIDNSITGYFTDFNNLLVHRNGNLQGVGTVTVTVYCRV